MSHATSSGWALRVEAVRPVAAGAFAWRCGELTSLTVVIKATFSIVEEGLAELIAPAPLCLEERFATEGSPSSPVEEPDLAPYKPQVDVTFVGSVHAQHPVQALRARLAVAGTGEGIDKSVQIVGDRVGASAAPRPFRQMQLGWERTWGSSDNPIGVTVGSLYQPNVIDPQKPSVPVGLGPIARSWAPRARLLGSLDPRWVDARTPHLPHSFAWEFFQAAPRDQRLTRLSGSETILLENLLEGRPRLRTRLPAARACARLHAGWTAPDGQPLDLAADTLKIDGDAQTVSIVWRASLPLPADASLHDAHVVAGVELPGFPMPSPRSVGRRASSTGVPVTSTPGTLALTPEDAQRLLASAPRPPAFSVRSPAATLLSPGGDPARRGLDPPTRELPIPVIDAPPEPHLRPPPEEATRQMSVARILADEATHESDPARSSGSPGSAAPSVPQSTSTLALTPEQASAMLASVGRHVTPGAPGGFPAPLPPPLTPPPMVKQDTRTSVAAIAPGAVAPPPRIEDVDTSGETFALTPEQAQRLLADAAAKKRR